MHEVKSDYLSNVSVFQFVADDGTVHQAVPLKPHATFADRLVASIAVSELEGFTLHRDGVVDEDGIGGVSLAAIDAEAFFPDGGLPSPPPITWHARYHDIQSFATRDEAVRQLAEWIVAEVEGRG